MTDSRPIGRTHRMNTKRIINALTILVCAAMLVLCYIAWRKGIFASTDTLKAFFNSMGAVAPIVCILVQVVQIVVPVIPAAIPCVASVVAFGPVQGFLYNYAGIVLGSWLAFALARRFGRPFIQSLVPAKTYEKYAGWLDKSQGLFDRLFASAIFLPFAPDDLLCMLAGVTRMTTGKFLLILLLLKPFFLLPYSFGVTSITALLGLGA